MEAMWSRDGAEPLGNRLGPSEGGPGDQAAPGAGDADTFDALLSQAPNRA